MRRTRARFDRLQLRSLETQLEPNLVFDRLDEIAQRYRLDATGADELLDRLIAYLRSAIPRVSAHERTLADEATLAAAYLRVLPGARAQSVELAIDIAPTLQRHPFPRKLLLPLVAAAVAAGTPRIRLVGVPKLLAGTPARRRGFDRGEGRRTGCRLDERALRRSATAAGGVLRAAGDRGAAHAPGGRCFGPGLSVTRGFGARGVIGEIAGIGVANLCPSRASPRRLPVAATAAGLPLRQALANVTVERIPITRGEG